MKVYGNAIAPTTQMVLIAIAEKGHEAEFVSVDLATGEQRSETHRSRHPFGLTPVLEDENGSIYEARAILRYLDRALSGPSLTPTATSDYARMEQFLSVEQAYFSPNIMVHFYAKFLGRPYSTEALEQATQGAAKALDVIEKNLEQRPYLAGEGFSLADVVWMPYLKITQATGHGDLLQQRRHVQDWATRLLARPSNR